MAVRDDETGPIGPSEKEVVALEAMLVDSRCIDMMVTLAFDGSGEVSVRERLIGGAVIEWREHAENQSQEKLW